MKSLKILIPIFSIIISISFIISSLIISSNISKSIDSAAYQSIQDNIITDNVSSQSILTFEEAADYLKISKENFEEILNNHPEGLRYVKVRDEYVFTIKNLNSWLDNRLLILKN